MKTTKTVRISKDSHQKLKVMSAQSNKEMGTILEELINEAHNNKWYK